MIYAETSKKRIRCKSEEMNKRMSSVKHFIDFYPYILIMIERILYNSQI